VKSFTAKKYQVERKKFLSPHLAPLQQKYLPGGYLKHFLHLYFCGSDKNGN